MELSHRCAKGKFSCAYTNKPGLKRKSNATIDHLPSSQNPVLKEVSTRRSQSPPPFSDNKHLGVGCSPSQVRAPTKTPVIDPRLT
jgi:hypothetical protein